MSFNRESSLLKPVASYVRRKSFRWQKPEVQFYEHRIDLYAYSRTKDLTIAIELKLSKWGRAFEQALLYQLCSDLVFLGLPKKTKRLEVAELQDHGIGVIEVADNGHCSQILPARQSDVVRPYYRDVYVELVLGGDKCRT